MKKKEKVKTVTFICETCGVKEEIPTDVVDMMDVSDGGDLTFPPRFRCVTCPGADMYPLRYRSPHNVTYIWDPKSALKFKTIEH